MLRLAPALLGGWMVLMALLGAAARLLGGSTEPFRLLCPDLVLLGFLYGIPDAPLAAPLVHGLVLLALAGAARRCRRPALALLVALALAVNGLALEVSALRLARQAGRQAGWSDEQVRDAWISYQGYEPEDFRRLRRQVAPHESLTFLLDGHPRSAAAAHFMGYALLPSRSYVGTPPEDPRQTAWRRPPPTDWVVRLRGGRVWRVEPAR